MKHDDLIKKWLNNELGQDEKLMFNQLEDAKFNEQIIENAKHFKASQFSETEDFEMFKKRYFARPKPSKRVFKLNPFLKIASILIVTLGLYFAFLYNTHTHVETLASEKATIELPDHSIVELNVLSKIDFNRRNWKENRKLELDGEAYFKVAKGKTFDVITSEGTITVVGTKFNVKQRDHYFEVKCFEGVVKVTSGSISRYLEIGDVFQILNGKFIQTKLEESSPKWIDNMSVFNAIPIKEVIAELERQYNVKVICNIDKDRLFTGVFTHNNLDSALIAITQPMNLTYTLNAPKQVTIHEEKD